MTDAQRHSKIMRARTSFEITEEERAAAIYVCKDVVSQWTEADGDVVDLTAFLAASIARAVRAVKGRHKCTEAQS
jgi:hypothetical protein